MHTPISLGNSRGFTLVDLIITLVIIGILATVAAAKYNDMSSKAEAAACQTNQASIQTANQLFYANRIPKGKKSGRHTKKTH